MPEQSATRPESGRQPDLDPERTTVHEALAAVPEGDEVFRRFGIDTCCGGELALAEAAAAHDVDLTRLLEALRAARGDG